MRPGDAAPFAAPAAGLPSGFVGVPATATFANGDAVSGLKLVPAPASGRVTTVSPGWQSMKKFTPPGRLACTTALPSTVTSPPPPPTGSWPRAAADRARSGLAERDLAAGARPCRIGQLGRRVGERRRRDRLRALVVGRRRRRGHRDRTDHLRSLAGVRPLDGDPGLRDDRRLDACAARRQQADGRGVPGQLRAKLDLDLLAAQRQLLACGGLGRSGRGQLDGLRAVLPVVAELAGVGRLRDARRGPAPGRRRR